MTPKPKGVCEYCRKKKKDVKTRIDPYRDDVWGEEVEVSICDKCYMERAQDV